MASEGLNTLSQRVDRLVPPAPVAIPVPRDVMLDIESLSLRPNALVLSIGACKFTCASDTGPIIGDRLLLVPDMTQQIIAGRHVDQETQKWWAQPENNEARIHWECPSKVHMMKVALVELSNFIQEASRVWANGICFDITVLEDLYRTNGLKVPWKYNVVRDARTFYDNNRAWRIIPGGETESTLPHHPVDDCVSQIRRLWEAGFDR